MNQSGKLLEIFDKNPKTTYEFGELHKLAGGDYKKNYHALEYLVKCKCVVKARPGLNGGTKCSYFKRTKEYNEKRGC